MFHCHKCAYPSWICLIPFYAHLYSAVSHNNEFHKFIYIYLVWKSASFCWFYTCDPFQLGACQFLCSEKEWVVYFGSLSPHHFWFYRLLWHFLSSVFYREHDPNCSFYRHCSMTCCPQRPWESYRETTQKFVETKQGMTAVCTFLIYSPLSHHSQLRLFLNQKR